MTYRTRLSALLSAAVVLLGLLAACTTAATPTPTATPPSTQTATPLPSPTPTPTVSPFPLSIVDGNGNEVIIERPPERILAIESASVEVLFAIGEGGRVVGTHDFLSYPPEALDMERVGSAFTLDLEKIVVLKPDLLFTFFDRFLPELEDLGVQVLYLSSPGTLEGVADRIRLWGRIVDEPEAAAALAEEFEESVEQVRQTVSGVPPGLRVYHDEAPGFWTSGAGALSTEVYALLNARNVFDDIDGFAQVSTEEIVARDPQAMVSVYPGGADALRAEPAFSGLSAMTDDRLLELDGDLLSIAGPRIAQGVQKLARFFYPGLFP